VNYVGNSYYKGVRENFMKAQGVRVRRKVKNHCTTPFNTRERLARASHISGHNSLAARAKELFKPSKDP